MDYHKCRQVLVEYIPDWFQSYHPPCEGFKKLKINQCPRYLLRTLIFYSKMKLLGLLKKIICEGNEETSYKIATIKNKNNIFLIYDTFHQRVQRNGQEPFTYKIEMALIGNKYKSGVYSELIVESIKNKFNKILDIIENRNNNDPIILVDEFDRGSDYIEYLIDFKKIKPRFDPTENIYKIKIITSAFSNDGLWIKKHIPQKTSDRYIIEKIGLNTLQVIFI